jgi:cobalt-zinc-cadmium efflux system outer membrane protein
MARYKGGIVAALLALVVMMVCQPARGGPLSIEQAKELVLESHQGLKALKEERAAAGQAIRQAKAYENPEIEAETRDWGQTEIEVVLTQPILIGGQRGAAIGVAEREARLADLRVRSLELSLEAELIRRFAPVLSAHSRLSLIDSMIVISAGNVEAIRRLVRVGATKEVDALRAELERDELRLERSELERSVAEAESRLGELWGDPGFRSDGILGVLPAELRLPILQELNAAMEHHPEIEMLEAQARLVEAEIKQARAEGRPELALSAGYYHETEAEEGGAIAGLSLSLPIFNRNQGAVAEKEHEMAAARHEGKQVRLERSTDLAVAFAQIEVRRRQLEALSGEVLTCAEEIHRSLQDFYLQGKTGILDILAARAHLLEIRMRIVDLMEERALLSADVQELTGMELEIIQ